MCGIHHTGTGCGRPTAGASLLRPALVSHVVGGNSSCCQHMPTKPAVTMHVSNTRAHSQCASAPCLPNSNSACRDTAAAAAAPTWRQGSADQPASCLCWLPGSATAVPLSLHHNAIADAQVITLCEFGCRSCRRTCCARSARVLLSCASGKTQLDFACTCLSTVLTLSQQSA